jgi:hypothetical protein
VDFLGTLSDDENLICTVVFRNGATSRLSGKVNKPNGHIWVRHKASFSVWLERDFPKVFYALSERKVPGPLFLLIPTLQVLATWSC